MVRGLKRTASQEKLAQAEWKIAQDKIKEKQERQVRERELEREKRNRELEERERQRAAWANETEEARKLMEAEQKVWKKKWPWRRWGKKSPRKRFEQEEAERVEARKKVRRQWDRVDGKVDFRPTTRYTRWSGPEYMGPTQPRPASRGVHHHHHSGGGGGDAFSGAMMGLALGIGMGGGW